MYIEGINKILQEQASINKSFMKCKTPKELLVYMDNIKYGWIDKSGSLQGTGEDDSRNDFYREYRLQSPMEISKSEVGVCWDQAELERYWFVRNWDTSKFIVVYIELINNEENPTHTFLVFKDNNYFYWFEHSWGTYKGIHRYNSLNELLEDVVQKHKQVNNAKTNCKVLITYSKYNNYPKYGCTCVEYMKWARNCKEISLANVTKNNQIIENTNKGDKEMGIFNEARDVVDMAPKSYPSTFIYSKKEASGISTEQNLLQYIMKAERINKNSEQFAPVINDIKTRQTTAVLYRVLMSDKVVLTMDTRELPPSFKVFRAVDVRSNDKEPKYFIDVTGLIKYNSGFFTCKEIDKLCTYLTAALIHILYYDYNRVLTTNSTISRMSTVCFVKLFTGILDGLRVIGYMENQIKIKYIVGVYFLYNLVGKDIESAGNMAANILNIQTRELAAMRYYYDVAKLNDIESFVNNLSETFNLKDLTVDIVIDNWMFKYGKGTMYGLELYPCFLTMITNAYCGAYVNNQKTIEKFCGKDMVTLSTAIIRLGQETINEGFHYVRNEDGEIVLEYKK